jgi:hypothetical protein
MTDRTARLALDLLEPGQAQKELHHNEALVALDLGVQASIVAAGGNDPPSAPAVGQCWIVGPTPTGAWTGQAHALAGWTAGGWRFVSAREGLAAWDEARRISLRFSRGAWEEGVLRGAELRIGGERVVGARAAAIPAPGGGATVDVEARAALSAMLSVLRGHGLISP